jgi:glycosyltransferase involved in cell wall biosynthesis
MNPAAPVTRTLRPGQDCWSDRANGTEAIYSVMRMLVCVPWYAPARAFGGTVTAAVATVKGAVEAGHDVTVATTDVLDLRSRLPADAAAEPPGARVVRFPNVSQRLAATNVPLPRGLRRWLHEHVHEFDVVLLLDVYSSVSVLGGRAAARAGVPYVLETLGGLPPTPERGRAVPKQAFLALWGRRTVREAAACLYLSERERDEYLAQGAEAARLHPMPPPLDLPDPDAVPRAAAPTIIYLGQLHPIKRINVLIDAFAQVRAELPDGRLEVIGAPSAYGETLKDQTARLGLAEAVAFRGLISEEDKASALGSAHVFALLSASEGLPITPLEALACGTPVVLSPGCGLPQVDGVAGVVCDGTAASAADALLALLRDPERARQLGEAGRALAAGYRRERVVPQLVALLERVATPSSSSA